MSLYSEWQGISATRYRSREPGVARKFWKEYFGGNRKL